jgi:hypothetical protein
VTVRGCVERDAAASTPIYKLVTPAPALKIYRLTAPKTSTWPRTWGTPSTSRHGVRRAAGRSSSREAELTVKKLTMVRDVLDQATRLSACATTSRQRNVGLALAIEASTSTR